MIEGRLETFVPQQMKEPPQNVTAMKQSYLQVRTRELCDATLKEVINFGKYFNRRNHTGDLCFRARAERTWVRVRAEFGATRIRNVCAQRKTIILFEFHELDDSLCH